MKYDEIHLHTTFGKNLAGNSNFKTNDDRNTSKIWFYKGAYFYFCLIFCQNICQVICHIVVVGKIGSASIKYIHEQNIFERPFSICLWAYFCNLIPKSNTKYINLVEKQIWCKSVKAERNNWADRFLEYFQFFSTCKLFWSII